MTSDDEILPEYIYVKKYFTNKLSSKELKATFTTAQKNSKLCRLWSPLIIYMYLTLLQSSVFVTHYSIIPSVHTARFHRLLLP